ncbi:ribosomal protein S18-alanine N-acetyltransferase [Mariprofundus ferrinatatus]|uniref:ribosomal protein S18-alanine N-acetyltransferase n=1 Tax=Mariprofundus ferrinatatus TaxID=1921087 RepID=UPI001E42F4C7|nr:ribosomal protein S18-alanine N-acetyltransferase [Mariprofundus ferrinatatus]
MSRKVAAGKSRWSYLNLPDRYSLRSGGIEDLDAVYRLSRESFDSSWSYESLYSALETGYDLIICERGHELAGYLLSMSILDETQIMQIAVGEQFRRRGLAEAMTQALIESSSGIAVIMLEVRVSNAAARSLYAKLGFRESGYRKNYYAPDASGLSEDAVLMELKLD